MDENNFNATISLDMKKFRIRVYKATLNLLGPPKYIQLLVIPPNALWRFVVLKNDARNHMQLVLLA